MKLWLVVPVKPLGESKGRLASVLPTEERAELMRMLLQRLLRTARETAVLSGVVVVSRDPEVWAIAEAAGAYALHEQGRELNPALNQARNWSVAQGAEAILVLPADLPWVRAVDIDELAAQVLDPPCIVIVSSRDRGTGALLLNPSHAIDFAFGSRSFDRHCDLARAQRIRCVIHESSMLAFDVDRPEDWAALQADWMIR